METNLPPTTITKPHTGMEFDSLHEAFLFYNEYAAIVGFSVRKDKTRKSNVDGSFLFRRFCCSKQGFPRNSNNSTPDPLKVELRIPPLPRLTRRAKIEFKKRAQVLQKMRVGCSARLDVKRGSHGKWVVQKFVEEHNHECVALGETHLLRSHRTRSGADPDPDPDPDPDSHSQCIVPSVGMEFESHHKAFLFYNAYARILGFIVRKDKTRKSNIDGSLLFRRFCCSREGYRRKSCEEDTQDQNQVRGGVVVKQRPRILPVTRVGCNARMEVKKTADGKWIVQKFIEQHKHEFDRLGDMNMLRSQKQLEPTLPQIVHPVFDEGTSTSQPKIIPSLSREPSGIDKAFSGKTRSKNRFSKKRKRKLEKGDLQVLFSYFSQMQTEHPSFFSSVQADEDDQMLSCFWADARSRMDFGYFGDVICIETNYGACQNGRPFIPILGVNHHLQTILLGCAIILNESEESFTWLLETMLKAMHGHCPLSIITDQDDEMQKAIDRVLPGTHHRLSLRYIFRSTAKNLSHLYNSEVEFGADFKGCIYEAQSSHEFEKRWASLLDQYELCHNEWLDSIYAERHKWVPTYSKHIFQADMITFQRSENMLSFFNDYLNRSLPLNEFVKQYEKALVNSREQEAYDDLSSYQVGHILKSDLPMEKQAAQVYTGPVFKEFQKEFCDSFDYIAVETATSERNRTFVVSRWGENSNCTVSFYSCDDETRASCSCLNFEFVGILCRHILKVFTATNIALVPEVYYKKRWTKRAKWGIVLDGRNKEMQTPYQNSISFRYSDLCRLALNICSKGAISLKAYQVAKSCILDKLRGIGKDAGEETQARINQLNFDGPRSSHPPVDVVENSTNSDHLATGNNNMLSVVHQVGFYDPTRVQARSQQPKRVRSSLGETQSSKKLRIAPDTSENVMPLHSRRGVPEPNDPCHIGGVGCQETQSQRLMNIYPNICVYACPPPGSSGDLNDQYHSSENPSFGEPFAGLPCIQGAEPNIFDLNQDVTVDPSGFPHPQIEELDLNQVKYVVPSSGWIKLSCKEVCLGSSRRKAAGFGGTISVSNESGFKAYAGPVGEEELIDSEVSALDKRLKILTTLPSSPVWIEGDSQIVIKWSRRDMRRDSDTPWRLTPMFFVSRLILRHIIYTQRARHTLADLSNKLCLWDHPVQCFVIHLPKMTYNNLLQNYPSYLA